MSKPRLLDLFCGTGGCARGYADAGFEVVGVDNVPQPHYPYEFICADALDVLCNRALLADFDAIHASPVCKGYTRLNAHGKERHPKLIPAVRARLQDIGKPYIIENVAGAKNELPGALWLCGTMFGLAVQRHRLFESNVLLLAPGACRHGKGCISVHGHSIWDSSRQGTTRKDGRVRPGLASLETAYQAMGIDWMKRDELVQAIPPAYTRWIGGQLLAALDAERQVAV